MSPRDLLALISFIVAMACALFANVFLEMMVEKVNQKAAEQIPFFMTPPVMVRIFREYRGLYPDGRLHVYAVAAFLSAVLSMLVFALALGLIPFS